MRFSTQPLVARTDGLNNFWDIDFKRFILQLFHIQPFYKRLSVFSTRVFLCFFSPTIRQRVRESAKLKREKKKKEKQRNLFSLFPTPTHRFRFRPDAGLNDRLFDMWCPAITTRNNFFNCNTLSVLFFFFSFVTQREIWPLFYGLTTSGPANVGNCF